MNHINQKNDSSSFALYFHSWVINVTIK